VWWGERFYLAVHSAADYSDNWMPSCPIQFPVPARLQLAADELWSGLDSISPVLQIWKRYFPADYGSIAALW